eukprot:1795934-Alexandrium_andersonii.AAC.1
MLRSGPTTARPQQPPTASPGGLGCPLGAAARWHSGGPMFAGARHTGTRGRPSACQPWRKPSATRRRASAPAT